jgi:hypothetical protein
MSEQERKELAEDLEQVLTARLRQRGILLNGVMLNRLESVSQLVAEVATVKQSEPKFNLNTFADDAIELLARIRTSVPTDSQTTRAMETR